MLASIPLTEDERAAVDDGQTAIDALLDRHTEIPTPAGPTPRELGLPATVTMLPIVEVRQCQHHRRHLPEAAGHAVRLVVDVTHPQVRAWASASVMTRSFSPAS
ncbi:hypothetical protein [Streptomyces sp. SD15]